jgi:hypothetical protein
MSKRLEQLKRNVETLRQQFLPDPFSPLGVYPNEALTQAHTRAFVVFAHAEIESFLEEWARDIVSSAESIWRSTDRITAPLIFLVASAIDRVSFPDSLGPPAPADPPQRLRTHCGKAIASFYDAIKANHGIKEKNVLSLLSPLGLSATALSPTLLPNLNSFGSKRGLHAHNSAKVVITILSDLQPLDMWLAAYKKRTR